MKTVLVVDNTSSGRDCIVEILGRCGYKVMAVQTGEDALSALRNDVKVDLVISEYQMPDMDGIVFVSNVKTFFPDLPVIMVTACGNIETYIKTLSLGVFEYMNKPIMAHELRKVVKAAMEKPLSDNAASF
jgi:DNA-binding NtrC family response regulator